MREIFFFLFTVFIIVVVFGLLGWNFRCWWTRDKSLPRICSVNAKYQEERLISLEKQMVVICSKKMIVLCDLQH